MKKVSILIVILLAITLSIFGSGKTEGAENMENDFFYKFRINDPDQQANNRTFVSERALKPGFKKYNRISQDGKNIYPLFNLDIYVSDTGDSDRINVKEFKISIPISISKKFIEDETDITEKDDYYLFVYLDEKRGWVRIDDPRAGIDIDSIEITDTAFNFTVVDWPVDDRMIASGN